MCGRVPLVFLGGRLSWVTDVSHLCAPVIESHLSVLHVLVVRLTDQFNVTFVTCRTQHTVTFTFLPQRSSNCGLTVSHRLDLSSTLTLSCRQKVDLLQAERDLLPSLLFRLQHMIDCINLHGRGA